jgi:DNA-binding GntR family transcriptional regulator
MAQLSERSGVPLYVQLRDLLQEKINQGEWQAFQQIPTEEQLAEEFSIARTTVRRALGEMAQRGLLYRKPGKGTFVQPRQVPLRLRRSVSFSSDMLNKGMVPGARLLSVRIIPADARLAEIMQVAVGADLIQIVRLRLADGRPVLINDVVLVAASCPGLESRPELREQSSLYQIITRDYGIDIAHMQGIIQPILADKHTAELLEIPPGSPIFRTEVTGVNHEGRAVIHAVDLIRGDWAFDISS